MVRRGLSYQDVLDAVSILQKKNTRISINSIRSTIGRGSPTTISKFLKQWKEDNMRNNFPLSNNKNQCNSQDLGVENNTNSIMDNWDLLLNETHTTDSIKIKKLYSALIKEQSRRKSAEIIAKEVRLYAEEIRTQTTKRIFDLRQALENKIISLNEEILNVKKESEKTINYYRKQLEKSNNFLAEIKYNNQ